MLMEKICELVDNKRVYSILNTFLSFSMLQELNLFQMPLLSKIQRYNVKLSLNMYSYKNGRKQRPPKFNLISTYANINELQGYKAFLTSRTTNVSMRQLFYHYFHNHTNINEYTRFCKKIILKRVSWDFCPKIEENQQKYNVRVSVKTFLLVTATKQSSKYEIIHFYINATISRQI